MPQPTAFKPVHKAAEPRRQAFDPWNSAHAGHQHAEASKTPGWQNSRDVKLNVQFNEADGGPRISDQRAMAAGKGSLVRHSYEDIGEMINGESHAKRQKIMTPKLDDWSEPPPSAQPQAHDEDDMEVVATKGMDPRVTRRGIFHSLTIYINGSSFGKYSDHYMRGKLKKHGATIVSGMSQQVTHVILGESNVIGDHKNNAVTAGGGLAAGKMQKTIVMKPRQIVQRVSADWVFESIKRGIRLPESRYSVINTAPRGVLPITNFLKRE